MKSMLWLVRWWKAKPVLASLCEGHSNNLNLMRMILASCVLLSHSWPIALGPAALEPLQADFGVTLGRLSVFGFFLISGLLVTQSLFRRHNVAAFVAARALRIFPGLTVSLLVTALVLCPLLSTLPAAKYYSSPQTWLFIFRNILLVKPQYELPGVFEHSPYIGAVNGSLWTLFYEVTCYATLAILAASRLFCDLRATLAVLVAMGIVFLLGDWFRNDLSARLTYFEELAPFFVLGVAVFVFRARIRISRTVAIVSLFVTIPLAIKTDMLPEAFAWLLCGPGFWIPAFWHPGVI